MATSNRQAPPYEKIKSQISYILSRQASSLIAVVNSSSSDPHFRNDECDRFDISIDYCGFCLNCQVIYDVTMPGSPPDLILPQVPDFYPSIDNVYGKALWNPDDETDLWKVMWRIRSLYAAYERRRVEHFYVERITNEYELLQHMPDLECRISLEKDPSRPVVMFRVPIKVKVRDSNNEDDDNDILLRARIFVEFQISHLPTSDYQYDAGEVKVTAVRSKLELPLEWEAKRNLLEIPKFEKEAMIVQHILDVEDSLHEVILNFRQDVDKKKHFFTAMCLAFRPNLLECDTKEMSYISLYFEVATPQDVYEAVVKDMNGKPDSSCPAVVNLHIGPNFPKEAPNIMVSSPIMFKTPTNHRPETVPIRIPSYNARWTADQMVSGIRSKLLDFIPRFHFQLPEKSTAPAAKRSYF